MKLKQKLSIFLFVFAMTFCMPLAMPQAYECQAQVTKKDIKSYTNQPYKIINNNIPAFTETEKQNTTAFETYSDLDSLGRCGVAYANICKELMPTSPREDIFIIHPSGWRSGMKWERCHLIGFQLAGENANEKNLITGTHYFNESGMLPLKPYGRLCQENRSSCSLSCNTCVSFQKSGCLRGTNGGIFCRG